MKVFTLIAEYSQKALVKKPLHPGLSALLAIGIMFLPAIPAYLWLWPNVEGLSNVVAQTVTYIYVLAGTLFIGFRRWDLDQLGLNCKGLGLSFACGLLVLAGRLLIILAIEWQIAPPPLTLLSILRDILFYFGLVGLGEELLFRGLVYRALEDWRSERWAIWGSSLGFALWHLFGQGPVVGAAVFLIGLLFAQIRWRAGGILGLILIHGLWDLETVLLVASSNEQILSIGRPEIPHPFLVILGLVLMLIVPLYLGWLHPRLAHSNGGVKP